MARIVVVDDRKLARDIDARSLTDAGHEVHLADPASLFEVLRAVRELQPRMVILDNELPHVSAETLVRVLREDPFLKDLLILVLSANHAADAVSRMLRQGVDGYAFKGNQAVLVEHVRSLLA